VTLLTSRPGGAFLDELKAPRIALQPFDTGIEEWMPGLVSTLKRLSPDLILCMGQAANTMIPAIKARVPAKIVATVRTGKRLSQQRTKSYRLADLVMVNSFAWEAALRGYGLQSRIEVVGNALMENPIRDEAARVLLRKKYGVKPKTTVILCLQRFLPGKRQHILMEDFMCAAHDLDAQLWLVGYGMFGWVLKAYAKALDANRIKIITQELPVGYYHSAAEVAATVSHEDSLPNFLIEAHAFGLPGICEDYAGCGEVVIGGITGFVIPVDDDAAYSTALRQLILSPSLRRFMGENARNLSFRFSHDRQMQGIFEILEGLCRK